LGFLFPYNIKVPQRKQLRCMYNYASRPWISAHCIAWFTIQYIMQQCSGVLLHP